MSAEAMRTADPSEFWRIPLDDQRDPVVASRLAALMLEHGLEVKLSKDGKAFLLPTAQPYSRFLDEMLGIQRSFVTPAASSWCRALAGVPSNCDGRAAPMTIAQKASSTFSAMEVKSEPLL